MKKRILSLLLCVSMLANSLQLSVVANEKPTVTFGGSETEILEIEENAEEGEESENTSEETVEEPDDSELLEELPEEETESEESSVTDEGKDQSSDVYLEMKDEILDFLPEEQQLFEDFGSTPAANGVLIENGELPIFQETEPNNSTKTADILPNMSYVRGSEISKSDTDYYKIKLTGSCFVQLHVLTWHKSLQYKVYNSGGSSVLSGQVKKGTDEGDIHYEALAVEVLTAGTYYIQFTSGSTDICDYSFGLACTSIGGHTHSYSSTITKEATCTSNGTKKYTCSCGDSYTETIPALGHYYLSGYCKYCNKKATHEPYFINSGKFAWTGESISELIVLSFDVKTNYDGGWQAYWDYYTSSGQKVNEPINTGSYFLYIGLWNADETEFYGFYELPFTISKSVAKPKTAEVKMLQDVFRYTGDWEDVWYMVEFSYNGNALYFDESSGYVEFSDETCPVGKHSLTIDLLFYAQDGQLYQVSDVLYFEIVDEIGGTCGSNLKWTLSEDGTFTLSGTGNMTLYGSDEEVPWDAYRDSIKKVVIGSGVTSISTNAFSWCYNLQSYEADSSSTKYKTVDGVLYRKDMSELLRYPQGKTATSYTVPSGVTTIWSKAFESCYNLKTITIPYNVTSIEKWAFDYCTGLENINVASSNSNYKSVNGVLFSKDGKTLIRYPEAKTATSYTVPNTVVTIGDSAFLFCDNLQSVTLQDGVTNLEQFAFYSCENLQTVTIPASVRTIGRAAFNYCEDIQDVHYGSTRSQWTTISIGEGNELLLNANIHYTEHNYRSVVIAPTCTERGYTTHTCTKCGDSYVDSYVNAKGHTEVTVAGKAATCTEAGLTDGKKCSACGVVTVKQEVIPEKGHIFKNGSCAICGEKDPTTLKGDTNGDNLVNSADVNLLYRAVMGYVTLTDEQMILADVNKDGKVNSADVNLLYRYVMGYVQSLTV